MVVLVARAQTSFVGPDLVTRMIEQFASDPEREGDRYKLRKAGTSKTHLFVWIEQHEFGAYESLCGEDLPESVPRLPRGITSVWVAATYRKGGIRVWFVRPPAPWQEIQ